VNKIIYIMNYELISKLVNNINDLDFVIKIIDF